MKKIIAFLVITLFLTINTIAATSPLLDPTKMSSEAQKTHMASINYAVNDGKINMYLNDDNADNWGWLVFDEYKHNYKWSDYDGVVIRIKGSSTNEIGFGLCGMTDLGQTGRVEFQKSGIVAYTMDGTDVSASFTKTASMVGPTESDWGGGDPCISIPAGFDGILFFPFTGAYLDDDCDLSTINSMASFLFGENTGTDNNLQISYVDLYKGNINDIYTELNPIITTEVIDAIPTDVVAPKTLDTFMLNILISIFMVFIVSIVIKYKKCK